jgi:hypothetical protein
LTRHIREDIFGRVLNHAFQERAQAMLDTKRDFVEKAILPDIPRARLNEQLHLPPV